MERITGYINLLKPWNPKLEYWICHHILIFSLHFSIQENSNRCRVNIPQVPQSTTISTTSFINRWFFRVCGMFQGYVGVFLQIFQIQLFLSDRDFPWFTFFLWILWWSYVVDGLQVEDVEKNHLSSRWWTNPSCPRRRSLSLRIQTLP